MPARRNGKFNNKICYSDDGKKFHSVMERARYYELRLLLQAGHIRNLQTQVPLMVQEGFTNIAGIKRSEHVYKCDFVYIDNETETRVYEDVKGHATKEFKLKRDIVEAHYNIHIIEVKM